MLFIGMKRSLTTYPIPPIIAKPIAHEVAIFLNSATSGFSHALKKFSLSLANFLSPWIPSWIYLLINLFKYYNDVEYKMNKSS